MPDYNIYIHSAISSSSGEATKPWTSKSSSLFPWNSEDSVSSNITKTMSKASGVMMNPDSLISQGVSMIAKAIPWVAIVLIGAKIVDKVVSTSINYNVLETGNYRDSVSWNNFKANLNWLFKPFSTTWNEIQTQNQYRVNNYRQTLQRQLLGDSVINSYTNRGV